MKENPENDRFPLMSEANQNVDGDPTMSAAEYMKDRLEAQMNWYDRKSSWNQQKYKKMKRIEIILAASIPVLIGISSMKLFDVVLISSTVKELSEAGVMVEFKEELLTLNGLLNIIAAIAGICLVVINKYFELEDYFKTWKTYRTTAEELQMERIKYLTKVEPYNKPKDAFAQLVENVEAILNKENQSWKERAKPNTDDLVQKATAALDQKAAELQDLAKQREEEKIKQGYRKPVVKSPVKQQAPAKKKSEAVAYDEAVEPEGYDTEAYTEPAYEEEPPAEEVSEEPAYDESANEEPAYDENAMEEPLTDESGDGGEPIDESKEVG